MNRYPEDEPIAPKHLYGERLGIMDKSTPVGSIGSCFAREVKDWLIANGYNYVQTSDAPHARHSSAAWERVYNTHCLRQEFERALGDGFDPEVKFWRLPDGRLQDPYRAQVFWADEEEMEAELAQHAKDAREALLTCKVFIITLGLSEVWVRNGVAAAQTPTEEEGWYAVRVNDVEHGANIKEVTSLMWQHNPDCRLIWTLSPVPLRSSFHENAIVGNAVSKASLRCSLRYLPHAAYFPSYEMVTTVLKDPFEEDNRHVTKDAVEEIMKLFEWTYCR